MLPAVRILIDYRPALRARSGVGEYVHELACALVRLDPDLQGRSGGVDLTLFSSSWRDRIDRAAVAGMTVIDCRVPVRALNFAWHRLQWPPIERLTSRNFDVAHSLHPLLMPARAAAQVVTVHDLDFLTHPERTLAEIRRDYPRLAARHVRRADQVIVNSRFTAGEVERTFGVPADGITVCSPGAPSWAARAESVSGRYVLFLGTLEPRKNVAALLDAYVTLLRHRPDAPELVLAGQATPAADPWLRRVANPPLAGHVRAIGYVPPDQRRELFEAAALLVIPSLHEGFGIPALEAMAVGVPVVAARRGALPEVLGDAGILVEPEPDSLADSIARVLDDSAEARRMTARGRERARLFTWDAAARAACSAYAKAIGRRRSRTDA
jgi:glycosyltransferase involved in cell wall biosynthesis